MQNELDIFRNTTHFSKTCRNISVRNFMIVSGIFRKIFFRWKIISWKIMSKDNEECWNAKQLQRKLVWMWEYLCDDPQVQMLEVWLFFKAIFIINKAFWINHFWQRVQIETKCIPRKILLYDDQHSTGSFQNWLLTIFSAYFNDPFTCIIENLHCLLIQAYYAHYFLFFRFRVLKFFT